MSQTDRYGLPLTTASEAAASAYREGIDLMLSAWPGADAAFDLAIAADPDFAMAHAARARLHFGYAQAPEARARMKIARGLDSDHLTPRERSHIDALALVVEGQPVRGLAASLAHLDQWPRDALILSQPLGAFGLFAFSGMPDHDQARVDLCERHATHYGDDWWFQTYRGWSHTENGNVGLGRNLTERALDQRRANANAAHALAHAMFEQGATTQADALIDAWLPSYDRSGILHGHIFWHQALAALENDDPARALAIYAANIQPAVTKAVPLNAMSDCASFLWRMKLADHAVPADLWTDVATYANRYFPEAGMTFADIHMAMIAAATGNRPALEARVAAIDKRLADGKLAAGPVVPAICRATLAFVDNDFAGCVRLLQPLATQVVRVGGSHAQREVIEDMLLVAHIKAGQSAKAITLLDERLHHRTSARDSRWRAQALGSA